jgi:nanoRNase/pAp phosphatase (c-di-AMP/oligoRNAs hydrolase)
VIYLLVSDDALFYRMVSTTFLEDEEVWSWAGRKRNGDRWEGPGQAFYGDLGEPETYAEIGADRPSVALVCLQEPRRAEAAIDALADARPEVNVLLTTTNGELRQLSRSHVRKLAWADVVGERLEQEFARLRTLERVKEVRARLDPAEDVALLVQPDPDPDGLASALALRQVLRRNKATAPIVTFGAVTRPENVAMLQLLEIDLEVIRPSDLSRFERVALLDVQPNVLHGQVDDVDVVIDHHPERKGFRAGFRDIRSSYGATATILTEYCRAAEVAIPERLATALLYGIKSDTLFLDRETSRADIAAFSFLYPLVNTNLLRRIEKPEVPRSAFRAFAHALSRIDLREGLAYVHLGKVEREDVIPQMAELALQLEGAEWSVASGLVGPNLVLCVRNAGYQKAAGSVVYTLFGDLGSAGGHQAMAKAVVPLKAFRKKYGSTRPARIESVVTSGFLEEVQCATTAAVSRR